MESEDAMKAMEQMQKIRAEQYKTAKEDLRSTSIQCEYWRTELQALQQRTEASLRTSEEAQARLEGGDEVRLHPVT